ncbi:type I restriction-modification system subunit M [Porphyromonas gingivalis]|uniref:site-specific DNA-methyltransferase (adenine-specific) n=1 Tax=Porphyromonas gingivalis TaxID=837 RepID=A0AAE9X9F8_PORGN|nr:class I SAM-dependent DNA methyltransferase [Porphyromonas gingivalis]WCG02534.1 class I SAM-dependent DNA methyltransferase [Porphyromonas gingivalis]SJL33889.1 N-6 DNA Methylase [Porphyromonas gingivalis]
MNTQQYNQLFSFVWNIANDVLVQAFTKGDYKKIILPMMVLRRLDILLEPTHTAVLDQRKKLLKMGLDEAVQEKFLFQTTGYPFCNTSSFTMRSLRGETNALRLKQNFIEYLDGFSHDVQDIIEKFKFKQQVDNLSDAGRLGTLIEKFTDERINLGILPVLDADGEVLLPGVDNHTMGTLFEQLLRKFNEENSVTEAGEHFTPRDYVALLADIAVLPIADRIESATYSIYDAACGTGGILSIAEQSIRSIAERADKQVKIDLYGQELQPETYATCKADLMLSTEGTNFSYRHAGAERQRFCCGSTISRDGHPGMKFDFCISNPPFGTPWKEDLRAWGLSDKEKDRVSDARFVLTEKHGQGLISFIPNIGDPQMLFLANNLSRIKEDTELGTRIVEVHNGSSLFTGSAGGGESNLRRYIIEHDLLEAVIAMPERAFYNTGIGTFIWVITNRKEPRRRGLVQLIDATAIKTPLRKNLGEKNCETSPSDRQRILDLLMRFEETPESKIFPNEEFGYWELSVERPLRLRIYPEADFSESKLNAKEQEACRRAIKAVPASTPLDDWDIYAKALGKMPKNLLKKLRDCITTIDASCKPVSGEADKNLSDTEQVPLRYKGGIEAFMQQEVLPYAPDAYVAESKIGYELSFTKYFYKPQKLRPLVDITADIRAIEAETDGLLAQILDL